MSEKSILEQALLQVQTLEEAVKQNAKGILASTMKEELSDLLKESLEEEEEVAKEDESKDSMDEQPTPDEEEDDMSDDDAEADDAEADDAENDTNLDNEDPSKGIDDMDSDSESDDTDTSMDDFGSDDLDSDEEESDDDVMDMTGASDEEVLKVFKAMKPEDGIVVKKDGNNVTFDTGEDEFIIKLDGDDDDSSDDDFGGMDSEMDSDVDSEMEEESLYEIELDESALKGLSKPKKVEAKESALKGLSKPKKVEAKESALKGLSKPKKVEAKEETEEVETEVDEASRTFGDGVRGPAQKKTYKAGRHEMNEEVENLKKQNAEYKKALVLFKDKLNEVAVFNANLAYATRLFTEHSTTKREKLTILKRFDGISTLSEAKNLFSQIKTELGTKTNVTESVVEKISNAPSTSSSQEVLSESKAYENPQFKRMKDLMSKIK
jgi:hypothetical protein